MATDTPAKPGYREFNAQKGDGSKVRLSVRYPYPKEMSSADLAESAAFNEALFSGLPTRARVVRQLRKNGMWTTEQEQELTGLRMQFAETEKALTSQTLSGDDRKALEEKLSNLDEQINEIFNDYQAMLGHTCDQRGEEARRNFLIACVVEYAPKNADGSENSKTGERYWDSVDAFLEDTDVVLGQRVVYEYTTCQNNVPSAWTAADERAAAEARRKAAEEAAKTQSQVEPEGEKSQEGEGQPTGPADESTGQPAVSAPSGETPATA